jgi:uncharacterized membrane protein YphA (DoxX/SURF4 family)
MATMLVAAVTVHWQNGWAAINESPEAAAKLEAATEILQRHPNYDWLTSSGDFIVLNNGIEFAATYFIMLLVLFFYGPGRYISLDYWLARHFRRPA